MCKKNRNINHFAVLRVATLTLILLLLSFGSRGQLTGLSDWTIYIDPGHALKENMGLYNYSEAEKVLRVGLALRKMFLEQTDIKEVYIARQTDSDYISLSGRVDEANTLGADFYYSIHSDAGPPAVNSNLMLYGGWKSNGVLVEKTPAGGGAFGKILDLDLSGAMRIGTKGNIPDRVFYNGDVHHHANQFPYLYVNRVSIMASLLSEAGFHTNPGQQMLNLNAEWKELEALSAFRSFLQWHGIDRPAIGVATGIIRDIETGIPLNGVTVKIDDQIYVTDSYESLFHHYSKDPGQLRNGFYYITNLEPLSTVEVEFSKDGYQSLSAELFIRSSPNGRTDENLSFLDPLMTSLIPPVIVAVEADGALEELIPGTPLFFRFSRKMDRESVENAFTIEPSAPLSFHWQNDFNVALNTSGFGYLQEYAITISGDMAKNELTGQFLDGNSDGTEGGDFRLVIATSDEDTDPPVILDQSPAAGRQVLGRRPIVRLVYDEEIEAGSVTGVAIMLFEKENGDTIHGVIHHLVVNKQSVLHFFPGMDLEADAAYTVMVKQGLSDLRGNLTEAGDFDFTVLDPLILQERVIDNFNAGVSSWWHPNQAGQTAGIATEITSRNANGHVVNHAVGSQGSMKLSYGWDLNHAAPYIRQHLPPTASQNNNRFNIDQLLQVYVFGDGSGNELRMVIRDGLNHLEGHTWIPIDWIGWKLITWDLSRDPVENIFGVGNGRLDGANFYMDGFHLRHTEGAKLSGDIYFDHLHFVRREKFHFSILTEPGNAGQASGPGDYYFFDEVTAIATAAQDFVFLNWTGQEGDVLSDSMTYIFNMPAANYTITANFQSVVGLQQAGREGLRVYPNPVKNILHILSPEQMRVVVLTDLLGREVLRKRAGSSQLAIDLDGVTHGIYVLQVHTDSAVMKVKIQVMD